MWSVSKVCDSVSTQINDHKSQLFHVGEQSFSLLEGVEFRVANRAFHLKISVYRSQMTFQMWNKTHLENGQISRWTVRRWQECVSHRSVTTALQRRKTLWAPPRSYYIHPILPVNCKTEQLLSICLQSLLLIEPLLAENHFAIILSPESVACSPPRFANGKGLSHSKCDDGRICFFSKWEDFTLPGDSSFQTKNLTCIQLQGGYICITINVLKITVHQSPVSLAENSQ